MNVASSPARLTREPVEVLGMHLAQRGGQMRHQRLVAVADLQQQIVGDLGRTARRALGHTPRQRLGAVMQQALKLGRETGQNRGGEADQQRRDKAVVQHHALVGPHLHDPGEADGGVTAARLPLQRETQAQSADRHRRGALIAGIGVDRLMLGRDEARHGLHPLRWRGLHAAGLPRRQQQIDLAVPHALGQIERASGSRCRKAR